MAEPKENPPAKYVPPSRRQADAKPSVQFYTIQHIKQVLPGPVTSGSQHTFVTKGAPHRPLGESGSPSLHLQQTESFSVSNQQDVSSNAERVASISTEQSALDSSPPSTEICRIMVHAKAHLHPPTELWTRNSFDVFEQNVGKPIPLFQESVFKRNRQAAPGFEFQGWFEIVSWDIFEGGSPEVEAFIRKRDESKREKSAETWAKALGQAWAKVMLKRVNDKSLGNPMEATVVV